MLNTFLAKCNQPRINNRPALRNANSLFVRMCLFEANKAAAMSSGQAIQLDKCTVQILKGQCTYGVAMAVVTVAVVFATFWYFAFISANIFSLVHNCFSPNALGENNINPSNVTQVKLWIFHYTYTELVAICWVRFVFFPAAIATCMCYDGHSNGFQ